jgi:cold shock CspA family protein
MVWADTGRTDVAIVGRRGTVPHSNLRAEEERVPRTGGMTVAKGMIRRLLEHRGFGFIESADGRQVFFHRSEVLSVPFSELQEGQVVEFAVEETPQGPKARRVHLATTARTTPLRPNE